MNEPGAEPSFRDVSGFVGRLRAAGLPIPVDASITFTRALLQMPPRDDLDLYWIARATLVKRVDDIPIFDAIFAGTDPGPEERDEVRTPEAGGADDEPSPLRPTDVDPSLRSASSTEALRVRSFGDLDPQEVDEMNALIEDLSRALPMRASRRNHRSPRGRFDPGATFRHARKTWGEPLRPRFQRKIPRQRRILFVIDISRSMEPYALFLMRFAYVLMRAGRDVEVFSFGTRSTRLTTELARTGASRVMAKITGVVPDWGGGTRIGSSLRELIETSGRRGAARGAIAVICSDGLDRGDPEELRRQMERLKTLSYRVVWVNPLAADPHYEPLARGMAAALPYVDHFVSGHALTELEQLLATFVGMDRSAIKSPSSSRRPRG